MLHYTDSARDVDDKSFEGRKKKTQASNSYLLTESVSEGFTPAKYDWDQTSHWLNAKHRILLYPSADEERFSKRKLANPVERASGPRDVSNAKIEKRSYRWKGRDGSYGGYETASLDKKSVYAERLTYPKTPSVTSSCGRWSRQSTPRVSTSIIIDDERSWGTRQCKSQPTTPFGSQYTISRSTTISEDDPSSRSLKESFLKIKVPKIRKMSYNWKGKRGSIGNFETIDPSKKKTFASIYPVRMMYPKTPKTPKTKSRNEKRSSRAKTPKTKSRTKRRSSRAKKSSVPKSLSDRRLKLKMSDWKPAKYDIPDPIAEIKSKGVNPPLNLYSGSKVHISTKKSWVKAMMKSPLPKKSLPPKEYHSRMKWIEEMEQFCKDEKKSKEQFSKDEKKTKMSTITLANCCEIVSPQI